VNLYRDAWLRHRDARAIAYATARADAINDGGLGPELRITDIDRKALDAWERSWARRKHRGGAGGWDWPELVRSGPRRAAVLPVAIWYAEDLSGLALGRASRSREGGVRHSLTLSFIERRPEPPPVALKGLVVQLVIAIAENYGRALGASRLRMSAPDPNLLGWYESFGFEVVQMGGRPLFCTREI
jgi:hypothetical protein